MTKARFSKSPDPKPEQSGLTGDEKVHASALEIFDLCVENEKDNRIDFSDDLTFARLGDQWTPTVRAQREREGRPCLTVNKMPAFIRQVVNDARQNKPGITVHPADDDADPETATVVEGLIRNIETSSNADIAYDTALDFAVSAGWGYIRVNTEYSSDDTFEQDIVIEAVSDPLTVYGDPYDKGADSAKWNHAFVVSTMPKDEFETKYKNADPVDWDNGPYSDISTSWMDGDLVVVAEYWCREPSDRQIVALSDGMVCDLDEYNQNADMAKAAGLVIVGKPRTVASHKVTQYTMNGAEVLETVAWAGRYIPIVPVYGEDIIVNGKRHLRSMVRDAKDSQRRVNFHTSAVTELVALAPKTPFIGKAGAFETDQVKWETANSESHAYIEYDGDDAPQRTQFASVPAGEMQQVLLASDDMKAIMGLHDASLGARSNETSGVAIKARQHEGDVSTFNFTDNLVRAIRQVGRVILDMIPEVYSVGRVIRIMGQDGTPSKKSIGPATDQATPQQAPGGDQGEVAKDMRIYDLTLGKYDLVVRAGPAYSTRREEAADQMMQLIQAFPAAAPVMADLLAKNLDWPGADEVADRLHALLPPELQAKLAQASGAGGQPAQGQQPGGPPAAQGGQPAPISPEALQAHQMLAQATQAAQALSQEVQQTKAALAQTQAQLAQVQGDRSLEARKLDIAEYEAETKRMAADAGHYATMTGLHMPTEASVTSLAA
jgi:hypothetical protein